MRSSANSSKLVLNSLNTDESNPQRSGSTKSCKPRWAVFTKKRKILQGPSLPDCNVCQQKEFFYTDISAPCTSTIHFPCLCGFSSVLDRYLGFLSGSAVKNLPAMPEMWVQSLGQEDPLEEGIATHCSDLAWRIPLTEESGRLQSMRPQRVGHDWSNWTRMQIDIYKLESELSLKK